MPYLDLALLLFLIICAISAVEARDLLSSVMILTVYSLTMALVWVILEAPDVAFTEAAVGAGITTLLFIAAISRTKRLEK